MLFSFVFYRNGISVNIKNWSSDISPNLVVIPFFPLLYNIPLNEMESIYLFILLMASRSTWSVSLLRAMLL